jgi:hypothetical protein
MADDAVAAHSDSPGAGWTGDTLEQRVQRLEDAVATLQDSTRLEERVTERVAERLAGCGPTSIQPCNDRFMESPRPTVPAMPRPTTGATPPPAPDPVILRQPWLLVDVLAELAAIFRMFFDVRYHVGWSARLTVLVLVPLLLLSHWWLALVGIPFVGPIFDKVVDLFLAFVIFKALSREARRYLQFQAERQRQSR